MDGWTIDFSPGDFKCQATWGEEAQTCGRVIPAGYIIAKHPNWDEWSCLNCMTATVRHELRVSRQQEAAAHG